MARLSALRYCLVLWSFLYGVWGSPNFSDKAVENPLLAFQPIEVHRTSRTLKQDIGKFTGKFINEFVDSVLKDDNKESTAEDIFIGQIVGGTNADLDRYPFICSLRHRKSKKHFCGCSLIRRTVVLTAAHCVDHSNFDYRRPLVHIGRNYRTNVDEKYEEISTKETIIHPHWDSVSNENDLALLVLSEQSSFQPISLEKEKVKPGTNLVVLGWGRTSERGSTSETLQEVVVPVLKDSECRKAYGSRISDAMFCAGIPDGGIDACQGDSGGPIIETKQKGSDKLVGVVSWGHGCARKGKPGVYSSVSSARDWIDNEIMKVHDDSPSPPFIPEATTKPSAEPFFECHCSDDGWSGSVRTPRVGCKRHLKDHSDNDAFCMVKEGPKCASSTPSDAYPGASWMLCDLPEEEEEDQSDTFLIKSSRLKRRTIKLKLGPLSFQIKLGDEKEEDEIEEACECSKNGKSGVVKTTFKGCKQHSRKNGRYDYWCMVNGGSSRCPDAKASKHYKGAAWRGCNPKLE